VLKKYLSFLLVILSVESIVAVNDSLVVSTGDVLVGELKTMEKMSFKWKQNIVIVTLKSTGIW